MATQGARPVKTHYHKLSRYYSNLSGMMNEVIECDDDTKDDANAMTISRHVPAKHIRSRHKHHAVATYEHAAFSSARKDSARLRQHNAK